MPKKIAPASKTLPTSKVKSATELGIKAESIGISKKPRTHKGKKYLESREPKLYENPKRSMLIKGNKTSQAVLSLLRDIYTMRGGSDLSKLFLRKSHEMQPFEDVGPIEQLSLKTDCSLFALGTHQKKRPNNLVLGRCFSGHILDMFEFCVNNYSPMHNFKCKDVNGQLKPILIFQGESFEFSDKHRRMKNFLLDFFQQTDYEEANIAEMKRVMVFTAVSESTIVFKHLEVNPGKAINETDVANATLKF